MTYEKFIQDILNTRGRFACGDEYHERHHIVPRCMNGTDDEDNLIDLFAREHFEAHRLLALENPGNEKLVYAYTCMAFMKRDDLEKYELTPEEYEEAKITFSKINSIHAKNRFKNPENNPMYGKHHTEETKNKIGSANSGRIWSEDIIQKRRDGQIRKWKDPNFREKHSAIMQEIRSNPEYKQKQRESHYGDKSWNAISIININNGNVYGAATLAKDELGIDNSRISKCCKGIYQTAGGYQWKYIYDYTTKDGTIIPGAITLGIISEEEVLKN